MRWYLAHFASLPLSEMEAHLQRMERWRTERAPDYVPAEHANMQRIYAAKKVGKP